MVLSSIDYGRVSSLLWRTRQLLQLCPLGPGVTPVPFPRLQGCSLHPQANYTAFTLEQDRKKQKGTVSISWSIKHKSIYPSSYRICTLAYETLHGNTGNRSLTAMAPSMTNCSIFPQAHTPAHTLHMPHAHSQGIRPQAEAEGEWPFMPFTSYMT
jgi:hypothetical protein